MSSHDECRHQVVDACHRLQAKGLLGGGAQSVSVRIAGAAAMAMTSAGADFAALTEEQVGIVMFDSARGAEQSLHATIYRERPDVGAIAHITPRWSSALHALERPMPGIFDEQVRQLGRSLQKLPYEAPVLGCGALALLKCHDNAFLFGEGLLCLGVTRDRVVFNAELLEKCAKAYLLAVATGRPVGTVPLLVREIAHRRMLKDQRKSAAAYARGEVPAGFTAY
jgi:ribulose-5-phosphate 4-epimerase/fuculose-1-phosphate aldolase